MSSLSALAATHTELTEPQVQHLQRLVGEWQLLADLSFADLLLWVVVNDDFLCVAQCRPTTGPTAHVADRVGEFRRGARASALRTAVSERRILRESDPDWSEEVPIRHEAIPVLCGGAVIAVLGRDSNLTSMRGPSQLEVAYLQSAADLAAMVADGTFPGDEADAGPAPRVGDGLLRLDSDGIVIYASPNALSAFRRIGASGEVLGQAFGVALGSALRDPLQAGYLVERVEAAVEGIHAGGQEVEGNGATVMFRPMPLIPRGEHLGALVLMQDVTELRRRDRQIMSKDATIREIHHRVKNNLQTVAALLRMQARRVSAPQARTALEEAMRRVSAIALVHETLAVAGEDEVPFDDVVDRLLSVLTEVTGASGRVQIRRTGSFGELTANAATPLVMVLGELVQNAVEHGFGGQRWGTVEVSAVRDRAVLSMSVVDDGIGLPDGFDVTKSDRLGLQIVRTLADAELHAIVDWRSRAGDDTGTIVTMRIDLTEVD
ncbi:MAG: putative two-component system sensor kinase [Pseudonocardiales bacterium]|nr:putative two-component system sensor kinase [Pseudonocardiales bacterium]